MTSESGPEPGSIGWVDISVDDASGLREFYESVVGWRSLAVSMGEYDDWCMLPAAADDAVAGICHKRGSNASLPSCWLIYVVVRDLDVSVTNCVDHGGAVLDGPRSAGGGRMAVIRDPAGASLALFEPGD